MNSKGLLMNRKIILGLCVIIGMLVGHGNVFCGVSLLKKYAPTTESKCLISFLVVLCVGSWFYKHSLVVGMRKQIDDVRDAQRNSEKQLQDQIKERDDTLLKLEKTLQDFYVEVDRDGKLYLEIRNLKHPEPESFKASLEKIRSNIRKVHNWRNNDQAEIKSLKEKIEKLNNAIANHEKDFKEQLATKESDIKAAQDTIQKQQKDWQNFIDSSDDQKTKRYDVMIKNEETLREEIRRSSDEIKMLKSDKDDLNYKLKRNEEIIGQKDEEINMLKIKNR